MYCADDVHSQQNRCLISGVRLEARAKAKAKVEAAAEAQVGPMELEGGAQDSEVASASTARATAPAVLAAPFFALLEGQLRKYETVLPMDLRVRGLVSAKYGYDGTALPWEGDGVAGGS